jgi:uncharacterized protein (DUF433 family)
MSAMKRMVEDIVELWEQGLSVAKIAESLRIDADMVEGVVEQYSNFFD